MRDEKTHVEVLDQFLENAETAGFAVLNMTFSPIKGPEGNIEYLGHLLKNGERNTKIDTEEIVKSSHMELS